MLFLDGVYVERPDGSLRFRWVKAPTSAELAGLTQTLARRIGRFLERQGLLERDAENSYLAGDGLQAGPMEQLLGSSITYRIAVGPQQGQTSNAQPAKCAWMMSGRGRPESSSSALQRKVFLRSPILRPYQPGHASFLILLRKRHQSKLHIAH